MIIPLEIETLEQEKPWANYAIIALSSLISLFALYGGGFETGSIDPLILDGYQPIGMVGHILLHGDFFHLLGNMVFLWVFGNAICTNTNNPSYLGIFLFCTLTAALTHNIADGSLAIGASGAINGIVGMTLAMYPKNRVYFFYWIVVFVGKSSCKAWHLILLWFLFDIYGFVSGGGTIAYAAHLGGFFGGLAMGLLGLKFGWFELTEYDNRSLLDILTGEGADNQRDGGW